MSNLNPNNQNLNAANRFLYNQQFGNANQFPTEADMHNFVRIQSEIAQRNLCAQFPYDNLDEEDANELTLRSGREEVTKVLEAELQQRMAHAGIKVIDAKISHLCYP